MKLSSHRNNTMAELESLDNRIRLRTLEQQILHLEKVIAGLEFGDENSLNHRNTLQQALKEYCQIYSALQKDRDISFRGREKH
ncbi:hypothetical protein [Halioxenophilus sp. WMMB6]|uniref:hypothetical protein n=1 Tax=Halioxenophilus sp. WMMB6 TaxID=3073815 RepID=UPI00295E4A75|nr:hypothetical protein [Halioxenophilus sp. WMMB6]